MSYLGFYQGVVIDIKDPEKRGRIRVLCPKVLGDKVESAWCDPMIPVAYDNGGDFCIPDVDETVWLQFIDGDANKPIWLGGWWQKNKTPLGNDYSKVDKVRIISYSDCMITMEEGVIKINIGEGNCELKIEQDKTTKKSKVTIEGDLTVKGDLKVEGTIVH